MVMLDNLSSKYVGKSFEMDCIDIEAHRLDDNQSPLFKGPGIIRGGRTGRLSYQIFNQIEANKEIFDYLNGIKENGNSQSEVIGLSIKTYDGIEWDGGWTIPSLNIFNLPYLLVRGEFDQLATRIEKIEGDRKLNCTEVIFAGQFDLPFDGVVKEKRFHDDQLISTSYWADHHEVLFDDSSILFQTSSDKKRTHVVATHGNEFRPPYVENWITEALTFITARVIHPRMVIRHFEKDALVFIRSTPKDLRSEMPPLFSMERATRTSLWEVFCAYLSKCKAMQEFEPLEVTKGFVELCLASRGTLQGFLISLSIFIEFCVNQICSAMGIEDTWDKEYEDKVDDFIRHATAWSRDPIILERAKGLLSMLKTPSVNKRLAILVDHGVITTEQTKIWRKARPYLTHGNVIDFKRENEFWEYRNHLISMAYRLILRLIGYQGITLDYNGREFAHVPYGWR